MIFNNCFMFIVYVYVRCMQVPNPHQPKALHLEQPEAVKTKLLKWRYVYFKKNKLSCLVYVFFLFKILIKKMFIKKIKVKLYILFEYNILLIFY